MVNGAPIYPLASCQGAAAGLALLLIYLLAQLAAAPLVAPPAASTAGPELGLQLGPGPVARPPAQPPVNQTEPLRAQPKQKALKQPSPKPLKCARKQPPAKTPTAVTTPPSNARASNTRDKASVAAPQHRPRNAGAAAPIPEAMVLERRAPRYPRRAVEMGMQGVVVVHVYIDASGSLRDVKVAQSSGFGLLDKAALAAVARWRFAPAAQRGQWMRVPIEFLLN